jgi:hypothetical protein
MRSVSVGLFQQNLNSVPLSVFLTFVGEAVDSDAGVLSVVHLEII